MGSYDIRDMTSAEAGLGPVPGRWTRTRSKADICVERHGGTNVLVKDFRAKNPLVRFVYGRFALRREAQAYARLSGVAGIPRFIGCSADQALMLEHIPCRTLSAFKRGEVPASVFMKLATILSQIHSRGVANGDLHRSNILIGDSGEVYIVDFASAVLTGRPERPGIVFRFARQLDSYAAAKIEARYLRRQKPRPQGVFGLLYRAGRLLKRIPRKLSARHCSS